MRNIFKLIFPGIVIGLSWNYPGHNFVKDEFSDRKEWIKDVTKKYSPDSWDLLMKYESLPEKQEAEAADDRIASTEKSVSTFYYLEGRSRTDLLSSMATNVHEIAHAYSGQNIFRHARENSIELDMNKAEQFFYYSPSRSFFISFPLKSLFPSKELKAVIPKTHRTFRFDTYINGITSTQEEGIIGLLNELHSYYLESKFCYELLEPYKIAEGSDASGFFEWVHNSQSRMSAFFEFDYFIKEYLLYMKKEYPAGYRELKNCKSFIEAYTSIRTSYNELINIYLQKIKIEMTGLNSSGKAEVSLENYMLWVREGNRNTSVGTPVFSADMEILLSVLESSRYMKISEDFPDIKIK
ncbi:MAG TPA: hypothetical protein VMW32_11290 [Bacteroidales bacterium]|nr:hypothetical protein [Bacteroidales bacterium]